ncbi:hypothetical protein O181_007714 [Austropuccinia psidii MF-1]|uniref:Retroviral polymerase SH3-like domain-containing protein n=1 Tax=Austropuccinia psidii MF-1 TaxID=1389203 RepID=A0A9Q3BLE0_9BASI|nr:hypothetical protein [Austropuccinia psidii MF-1]
MLLSNLIPTPSRHNFSPYASWTGNSPRIKKLQIFEFQAVVLIQQSLRDWKLRESGCRSIFLGYKIEISAYWVLWIKDSKVLVSKHVLFDESFFPFLLNNKPNDSPLIIPSTFKPKEGLVDEVQPSSDGCLPGAQEAVDELCPPESPSSNRD